MRSSKGVSIVTLSVGPTALLQCEGLLLIGSESFRSAGLSLLAAHRTRSTAFDWSSSQVQCLASAFVPAVCNACSLHIHPVISTFLLYTVQEPQCIIKAFVGVASPGELGLLRGVPLMELITRSGERAASSQDSKMKLNLGDVGLRD